MAMDGDIKSNRELFYDWLKSRVSLTDRTRYVLALTRINDYFRMRYILTKPLLETTDIEKLHDILLMIEKGVSVNGRQVRNKRRYTSPGGKMNMMAALRLYLEFLKEQSHLSPRQAESEVEDSDAGGEPAVHTIKIPLDMIRDLDGYECTPCAIFIGNQKIQGDSWATLYTGCWSHCYKQFPEVCRELKRESILTDAMYIVDEIEKYGLDDPYKIDDGFYLDIKIDVQNIMDHLRHLLDSCHIPLAEVQVEIVPLSPIPALVTPAPVIDTSPILSTPIPSPVPPIPIVHTPPTPSPVPPAPIVHIPPKEPVDIGDHPSSAGHAADPKEKYGDPVLSMKDRYRIILQENFPDGMILNGIHFKKFKRHFEERFSLSFVGTMESLFDELKQIGTLRDGRIFAVDETKEKDILNPIKEEIVQTLHAGASAVYWECIFQRYQEELTSIKIYTVQDVSRALRELLPGYKHTDCCIETREGEVYRAGDISRYFYDTYESKSIDEVAKQLWFLPKAEIKSECQQIDSLINIGKDTYFYAPNFPLAEEERHPLQQHMQEKIDENGSLTANDLEQIMQTYCPTTFLDIGQILKPNQVTKVVCYLFREEFSLNGALVTRRGKKLNLRDACRQLCRSHEELSQDELTKFAAKANQPVPWAVILDEMVRVTETRMLRRDQVHFAVEEIDEILDGMMGGKSYMPIQDVPGYLGFPSIQVPWNSYVLESYLVKGSSQFALANNSFTPSGVYGLIVRQNASIHSYEDAVTVFLSDEQGWSDKDSALALLKERGIQARKRLGSIENIVKEAKLLREKKQRK